MVAALGRKGDETAWGPSSTTWWVVGSRRSRSVSARRPAAATLASAFGAEVPIRASRGGSARGRIVGAEAWVRASSRPPRVAADLGRFLPSGCALDPPACGHRADGPLRPRPGPGCAARELVRAGQPERRDRLHRPGLSMAGGRLSDLHLARRPGAEPAQGDRDELRGNWFLQAASTRGGANTGSTRALSTWATPGPARGRGYPPPHRCPTACARSPPMSLPT